MSRDNKDLEIKNSYKEYDIKLRKKRLETTLFLGMFFVLIFVFLDKLMYPDFFLKFTSIRLTTSFVLLILLVALKNEWINSIKSLGIMIPTIVFIMIDTFLFLIKESNSPYYAGLTLTIVALSTLMAWTFYETILACSIMLILYLFTVYSHSTLHNTPYFSPIFTNNIFFLVSISVFCVVSSYLNNVVRFKEFYLNYELEEKNLKLQSTQAQLIQSEKINAIGSLSAGLLHEVNNPLNYTMTALQVMKMDPHVSSDEDLKDTMKDIEEGMNRIKHIVTDLRAFAYPEEADKRNQFSILSAIENALRFTASETQDIEKIVDADESFIVSASKTHVVQVLINLVSNAARAITKSGKKDGLIKINATKENDRVIIKVSDNGTGMSEETLKKVFDPFFTTNEVGKGMGLGLSVSHTIVRNHGGNLKATSKLGEGSVFCFDLGV